ncbi:MAG: twin-arginine translocation signal domain-containing protein, partial [Candidatus Sedimenticola sp. 6PFRAG5]
MAIRNNDQLEQRLGVSRRDFLKFCTGLAATMGLT